MAMGDIEDNARAQLPLAGAIICCTSIVPEQRTQLAIKATEMGAVHKYDLTSDVTHLVVGSIDTPKYRYVAKERPDVKVVTAEWIEAVREKWMEGEDPDVELLEHDYKVPTFFGFRICVTGFNDVDQRQYLMEAITRHGAAYHPDLTKSVTHLIAAVPQGKKYDFARSWNIKVVSLEWLQDSLERGMTLDESLYDPLLPKEERGKGAWNRIAPVSVSLGKRLRDAEKPVSVGEANKRKIRRTASMKLGSQSQSLWADITAGSFTDNAGEADEWQESVDSVTGERFVPEKPKSKEPQLSTSVTESNPLRRSVDKRPGSSLSQLADKVFEGRIIHTHGFDDMKTSILHEHLRSNGATVAKSADELSGQKLEDLEQGFLVLPADKTASQLEPIPEQAERLFKVTNWWVENCLHKKKLVDPVNDVLRRPFVKLGIEGFEGLVVGSTGFAGIDLLHLTKVVELMGAKYDEFLKPTTSVLICSSVQPNKPKLRFATEHDIPAVTAQWLWNTLDLGRMQSYDTYRINPRREEKSEKADTPDSSEKSASLPQDPASGNQRDQGRDIGSFNSRNARKDVEPAQEPDLQTTTRPRKARQSVRAQNVFFTEDDDLPPPPYEDENDPHALQERPSAANSLRRSSTKPSPSNPLVDGPRDSAPSDAKPPHASPATNHDDAGKEQETLASDIASLIAHRKQSSSLGRTNSASSDVVATSTTTTTTTAPGRSSRRRGLLARAPSNAGAGCHSSGLSGNADHRRPTSASDHAAELTELFDVTPTGGGGGGSGGASAPIPSATSPPGPSQALVYEDAGLEAEKARLIRRMGGQVDDAHGSGSGRRQEGGVSGLLRDARESLDGGVGGRVGRRRAAAREGREREGMGAW